MFEALFIDRDTIARYRCEPLLEERLSYLRHCAQQGTRPLTLRTIAAAQVTLIRLLDLSARERVSVPRIEAAANRRSSPPAQPRAHRSFVSRAVRWLRFAGLLEEPCRVWQRHAQVSEVAVFKEWMRKERGWSESTIRSCCNTNRALPHRGSSSAPGEGAVPHADSSDPSGDPAGSFERRQDTPRSARYQRQASRCTCASPCCRAAPARPRPFPQGGRRLPGPSQHLIYRSVRQGTAKHPSRGRRHRSGESGMILRDAVNNYIATGVRSMAPSSTPAHTCCTGS